MYKTLYIYILYSYSVYKTNIHESAHDVPVWKKTGGHGLLMMFLLNKLHAGGSDGLDCQPSCHLGSGQRYLRGQLMSTDGDDLHNIPAQH